MAWSVAVYLAFFVFARMHILSYYLDFLRVFSHPVLMLGLLPRDALRPWSVVAIQSAWWLVSAALVLAFLLQWI